MGKKKTNKVINNEHYTPTWLIDQIREFLGGIELDVASSEIANRTVKAERFFTKEDNALSRQWLADTVFMNPPYLPTQLITDFINKCISEYVNDNIREVVILTHNSVDTKWAYELSTYGLVAYSRGRIGFMDPEGNLQTSPGSGHILTYLGKRNHQFLRFMLNIEIPNPKEGRKGYPRGFYIPNEWLIEEF